jgi:hypothetical protein
MKQEKKNRGEQLDKTRQSKPRKERNRYGRITRVSKEEQQHTTKRGRGTQHKQSNHPRFKIFRQWKARESHGGPHVGARLYSIGSNRMIPEVGPPIGTRSTPLTGAWSPHVGTKFLPTHCLRAQPQNAKLNGRCFLADVDSLLRWQKMPPFIYRNINCPF